MVQTHQLKDRDYQIRYKSKVQQHAANKNPLEDKNSDTFEVKVQRKIYHTNINQKKDEADN